MFEAPVTFIESKKQKTVFEDVEGSKVIAYLEKDSPGTYQVQTWSCSQLVVKSYFLLTVSQYQVVVKRKVDKNSGGGGGMEEGGRGLRRAWGGEGVCEVGQESYRGCKIGFQRELEPKEIEKIAQFIVILHCI